MFREVHVAAISFKPKKLDLASNANRLETMFREAASGGAQLAVFSLPHSADSAGFRGV